MNKRYEVDLDEEYVNIFRQARKTSGQMKKINETLKKIGLVEETRGDMGDAIIRATQEKIDNFPAKEIQEYISGAYQLSRHLETFNDNYERNEVFEVSRQKAIRKAEREDVWKLWRDKIVRWILGVSLALIIYSFMVFISNKYPFITIPIRDLILAK